MHNLRMLSTQEAQSDVTGGCYSPSPAIPPPTASANVRRLLAVKTLFGLQDAEIARATKYSRPYVVRLLSGDLEGSASFYTRLENALAGLVAGRDVQVFDIPGTAVPLDAPGCAGARHENIRPPRAAFPPRVTAIPGAGREADDRCRVP